MPNSVEPEAYIYFKLSYYNKYKSYLRYPKPSGIMTNGKSHFMARTVGEDMDDSNEKSEEVIDVETSSDTVSSTKKLSNLLPYLCNESSSIKAVLCSLLSQTSLQNISANNMCGQGKNKVKKEYLANSVQSLLRITEAITPIIIGRNKELELE